MPCQDGDQTGHIGETSPVESLKISLAEDYASDFNEALKTAFYAVADPGKSDDEIHRTLVKADEVFLSDDMNKSLGKESKPDKQSDA